MSCLGDPASTNARRERFRWVPCEPEWGLLCTTVQIRPAPMREEKDSGEFLTHWSTVYRYTSFNCTDSASTNARRERFIWVPYAWVHCVHCLQLLQLMGPLCTLCTTVLKIQVNSLCMGPLCTCLQLYGQWQGPPHGGIWNYNGAVKGGELC